MKLSINRNSLMYRLATVYGSFSQYEKSSDLCTYFWQIVMGFVVAFASTVLVSILGGTLILLPGIAVIEYLSSGYFSFQEPHTFLLIIDVIVIVGIFVVLALEEHGEVIAHTSVAKLAKAGYRGWKEKTCVLVEVK